MLEPAANGEFLAEHTFSPRCYPTLPEDIGSLIEDTRAKRVVYVETVIQLLSALLHRLPAVESPVPQTDPSNMGSNKGVLDFLLLRPAGIAASYVCEAVSSSSLWLRLSSTLVRSNSAVEPDSCQPIILLLSRRFAGLLTEVELSCRYSGWSPIDKSDFDHAVQLCQHLLHFGNGRRCARVTTSMPLPGKFDTIRPAVLGDKLLIGWLAGWNWNCTDIESSIPPSSLQLPMEVDDKPFSTSGSLSRPLLRILLSTLADFYATSFSAGSPDEPPPQPILTLCDLLEAAIWSALVFTTKEAASSDGPLVTASQRQSLVFQMFAAPTQPPPTADTPHVLPSASTSPMRTTSRHPVEWLVPACLTASRLLPLCCYVASREMTMPPPTADCKVGQRCIPRYPRDRPRPHVDTPSILFADILHCLEFVKLSPHEVFVSEATNCPQFVAMLMLLHVALRLIVSIESQGSITAAALSKLVTRLTEWLSSCHSAWQTTSELKTDVISRQLYRFTVFCDCFIPLLETHLIASPTVTKDAPCGVTRLRKLAKPSTFSHCSSFPKGLPGLSSPYVAHQLLESLAIEPEQPEEETQPITPSVLLRAFIYLLNHIWPAMPDFVTYEISSNS